MSGVEVAALAVGMIGATAGSVSAYKDLRDMRRQRAGMSLQQQTRSWTDGKITTIEKKTAVTTGDGDAGVKANGDVYACSSGNGAAVAEYYFNQQRSSVVGKIG